MRAKAFDVEALLADPEMISEAIKQALSGEKRDFLDEALIDFLRGYFKNKAKLEIKNV